MEQDNKKYCMFLDLETGGFSSTKNAICEIAFLVFDTLTYEIVSKSCFKIKPYLRDFKTKELASYKEDALKLNGHTEQDLKANGIEIRHALLVLDKVIKQYNIVFFGGHNVEVFDIKFIQNVYSLYLQKDFTYQKAICTLSMAKLRLSLKSYSLESVCQHFELEPKSYHTAMADTEASFECFKLLRQLPILNKK
jgi:DNA polymerase III alpha subunit (gram-positive type)